MIEQGVGPKTAIEGKSAVAATAAAAAAASGPAAAGSAVVPSIPGPSTTAATGTTTITTKPPPMKLFSTWEVDKSTPSCVPRLCSLTISRLHIVKPLEHEPQSITISMKMQSSKLVLRSNEIVLPISGVLDIELELSFALLYPHFLKRDGNLLQVMLQRRNKYKNHMMLGYKTLASGRVNMSQVLQHPRDVEVPLYIGTKEHGKAVAHLMMLSLCSQPVDQENPNATVTTEGDRSPGDISEDDDIRDDQEFSSNDDLSDVEHLACDEEHRMRMRKSHQLGPALASRQRNLKQKFISLLRRFKVTDEVLQSAVNDFNGPDANQSFVEELFDEVENLSDSDLDIDTISIQSTPKPKLKPFFAHQTSNQSTQRKEKSPCREVVERAHEDIASRTSDSDNGQPRRALLDQLITVLSSDSVLPECVVMISNQDCLGQSLTHLLHGPKLHAICVSAVDVKLILSATVNRIQKYCCKKTSTVLTKLAIIGNDSYISSVLKSYVELMSSKSPEWLTYLRFFFVPYGNSLISKNLSVLDAKYGSLFNDAFWKDNITEKLESCHSGTQSATDMTEVVSRINRYLSGASHIVHLPLAEAILANKDKGTDDTSQLIVPFIGEVRLGPTDVSSSNLLGSIPDQEEAGGSNSVGLSSSPPCSASQASDKPTKESNASAASVPQHPSAPSGSSHPGVASATETPSSEAVDLQIDYWLIPSKVETSDREKEKGERLTKKELKYSLKMMFRSMQVFRPLQLPAPPPQQPLQPHSFDGLSMIVVTREKKQKMMRIGKKSKDLDATKSQQIDSISRLICTSKSQNHLLSVSIDGVEWTGVKFFQVSAQWQTHVKHFPVFLFSSAEVSAIVSF